MSIVHVCIWVKMRVAKIGVLVTVQQTQPGPPNVFLTVTNQTKKQVSLEVRNIL